MVPAHKRLNTPLIVGVSFLIVVFFALFYFKDRLVTGGLLLYMRRLVPDAAFAVRKVTVGPGSIVLKDFSVIQKAKPGRPRLEIRGSGIAVRVSPLGFFVDPLLGIKGADLRAEFIQWGAWTVRGFHLRAEQYHSWPYLRIQAELTKCSNGQKEVKDVSILMLADKKKILVNNIRAVVLGGYVHGSGFIAMSRRVLAPETSSVVLYLKDIHLEDVMSLLGGSKGMETSGIFTGQTVLIMQGNKLQMLRGELDSVSGGSFLIKDPSSLVGQGPGGRQDQNIVIENLKNYYYDIGKIELRNLGQDIRMDVILQGKAGRRDLELFWHGERKER